MLLVYNYSTEKIQLDHNAYRIVTVVFFKYSLRFKISNIKKNETPREFISLKKPVFIQHVSLITLCTNKSNMVYSTNPC